jgi:mono-ADP-ribosyltransferase sirtuin 6
MGSSLTVTPAANIPKNVGKKGKLIIINLQKTPLDQYAFLRINALCDDVMKRLALKL